MNRRFNAIKGVNRITAASLVAALGLSLSSAPAFAEGRDGSGSGKRGGAVTTAEPSERLTSTTRRSGSVVAPTVETSKPDDSDESETETSKPTTSRPTTSSEKKEDAEGKSGKSDRTAPPPTGADGAPLPTSSSKKGERADRGEHGTETESESESDDDSSTSTTLAGTPRGKAADSIAKEIERIRNSDLAPEVKDKVIALLTDARQHVEDDTSTSDDGAEVRARIEAERKARLQETAAKLAKMAVKISAFVDRGESAGVPADAIAKARDQIAQANALIASAASADDLRAAWKLLREARIAIATLLEPPPTAVSTPIETTTTTVPDQETTTTTAGG